MVTTEHRPVPLPNRPATQPAGDARPKRPLPAGAKSWSKAYLDENGVPARSEHPVPVDEDGQRTAHVRHTCPHKERAGGGNMAKLGCGMEQWLEPGKTVYCPDHGEQLVADNAGKGTQEPLIPWGEVWKTLEKPLRPAWALAAELAAGVAAHQLHLPAVDALMAAGVLAGGGYVGVRMHLTRREQRSGRLDKGQRDGRNWRTILRRARTAAYLGLAAGGWLTWFSDVDPHSPFGLAALVALPVAWAVGSQPWRRYVTAERNRRAEPTAPPQPVRGEQHGPSHPTAEQLTAAECATRWSAESGLPNTRLDVDLWEKTEFGWQAVVVATKRGALINLGGEQKSATIRKVAATYDVSQSAVNWLDEWGGNPNRALVLVQPNNPLHHTIPGRPIDILPIEKAVAHMGMRINGSDLTTRLFQPGWGAPSRLIIGTKGAGKTELLRRLLLAMLKARILRADGTPTRLVAPFLHDPKRGADYGMFRRLVSGFSIDSDTLHMIVDALAREMDRRYDMLAGTTWEDEKGRQHEGERPWDPATMGPVLSLVCDEFHIDAKDQALMAKLDPFGRKMRAAGMEINIATHLSTIGDTGSQGFRDMLSGGEAWLLRTTLGLNAALATGGQLVGDPRSLPRIPGMLYQASGEDATLLARAAYDDPEALYDMLFDDANEPLVQPIVWPQETLDAFGHDFVDWMRQSQNRPLGSPVPEVPKALKGAGAAAGKPGARNVRAEDALRQILFEAGQPLKREFIVPLFEARGFNVTSTLTAAKNAGLNCNPPWLVDLGNGVWGLSLAMRQQMAEAVRESSENAA